MLRTDGFDSILEEYRRDRGTGRRYRVMREEGKKERDYQLYNVLMKHMLKGDEHAEI